MHSEGKGSNHFAKINSHNNFLGQTCHLSLNIKNIKGIKVPLGYNQLSVIVFTDDTSIKRDYSLPETKTLSINLTHSKIADKGDKEVWTISGSVYKAKRVVKCKSVVKVLGLLSVNQILSIMQLHKV